jgi:NADPH-dependent glutamate synthase beta subunit-like oxidoreductase
MVRGADLVVTAIADARKAADGIVAYLSAGTS